MDENGQRHGDAGYIDDSGKIHIDIFAGQEKSAFIARDSTLTSTLLHELTHFIHDWSSKAWKEMYNYVVARYSPYGSVQAALEAIKTREELEGRDENEITDDFLRDEFMAQCCEALFEDEAGMRDFAAKYKNTAQKIVEWLENVLEKISGINMGHSESDIAAVISQWQDGIEELREKWLMALEDAANNKNASEGVLQSSAESNKATLKENKANENGLQSTHTESKRNASIHNAELKSIEKQYDKAVKTWDYKEKARLVEKYAKLKGAMVDENGNVIHFYRGVKNGGDTVFDAAKHHDSLIFLTTDKENAIGYGGGAEVTPVSKQTNDSGATYDMFCFAKNVLSIDGMYSVWSDILVPEELQQYNTEGRAKATTNEIGLMAKTAGYDGVMIYNVRDGSFSEGTDLIIFDGNLLKSADSITYDNNGDIIPLSQRFNQNESDIRRSRGKRDSAVSEDAEEYKNHRYSENRPFLEDDIEEYMNTGKKLHTRDKKSRMLKEGKKPYLTTVQETKQFIRKVIHGESSEDVSAFARVGSKLSDEISQIYHVDLYGRFIELNADLLRESYKKHINAKEKGDIDLSDEDFESIPELLNSNPTALYYNKYKGKIEICFSVRSKNGYILILTVVSSERNSIQVTKVYGNSVEKFENRYGKKIRKSAGSLEGQKASNPYKAVQYADSTLSNGIIPQDGVKSQEESEKNSSTENGNKRFSRSKRDEKSGAAAEAEAKAGEISEKWGLSGKKTEALGRGLTNIFESVSGSEVDMEFVRQQAASLAAKTANGMISPDMPADISDKLSFLRSFGAVSLTEEQRVIFCKI